MDDLTLVGYIQDGGFKYFTIDAPDDAPEYNHRCAALGTLLARNPVEATELVKNLGLWQPLELTARLMFLNEALTACVETPGSIMLMGLRYGRDLITVGQLQMLHGTHSPMSGFDTFAGHAGSGERDGDDPMAQDGAFGVHPLTGSYLSAVLKAHGFPFASLIVKGDVRDTIPRFLEDNPHTQVRLLLLDLDLYEPTRLVVEQVRPRLMPGSVVVFDELSNYRYPGETVVYRELFDGLGLRITRAGWIADQMCYGVVA